VQVHALAKWEGWRKVAVRGPRPPESMILAEGLFERLAADVRGFLDARGWYGSLGIPWKRGFLLYGPPGNGKSSLVLAIATMLGCDLYLLNLANAAVDDESLPALLSQVPCGSVVLIEEIDTLFDQREKTREGASRLTFGGLLSALDGPASQEGLLLFMTTNHPEKLDPALVRPGRIDLQLAIENPTPRQVQRLFERFYPQAAPHLAHLAAERVPAGQWGMAVLQEHFMRFRDDPEGAVEALPQETSRNQAAAETPRPHCLVARV
jgi:chaperone BCS1